MVETTMRTTCDVVSIEQKTTSSDLSLDATAFDSIESQNAQWAHGEFFIPGLNVTMGHQDNPEANKTAFQFRWFRTGDLGYLKKLWEEVRKTVFVVRQTESKGGTSRVFVRGVHATEEPTYNAAIANFIYSLQQEDRSMLSKFRELWKTTTLSHKGRLQSCQDPITENLGERISSEMENVTLLCVEGRTWMIAGYDRKSCSSACKVTDKMQSVAHPNCSRNDDAYELEQGDNEFSGPGVKKTPFLQKQAMPSWYNLNLDEYGLIVSKNDISAKSEGGNKEREELSDLTQTERRFNLKF
ncbi:hypothetical protein SUGI_1086720 [Cryptomeria japonica]|nr:hypothetical protein SUGI_1086720 [Cryptomeria japonica]